MVQDNVIKMARQVKVCDPPPRLRHPKTIEPIADRIASWSRRGGIESDTPHSGGAPRPLLL